MGESRARLLLLPSHVEDMSNLTLYGVMWRTSNMGLLVAMRLHPLDSDILGNHFAGSGGQ